MPHALSDRQKEVLGFIKNYIRENESSPRLDEISNYFGIKPPTTHKILESLQSKGYLYFSRDRVSGFFIRLIERAGSSEQMVEIPITGRIDRYGEIYDFPKELGHFASVVVGANPTDLFALCTTDEIPLANICSQDLLIFDISKKPQSGDVCLMYFGERLFLIQIASKTYDENLHSLLLAQQYPIPSELENPDLKRRLNWIPLSYSEETKDFFMNIVNEQGLELKPISPDLILATALRLVRQLAF